MRAVINGYYTVITLSPVLPDVVQGDGTSPVLEGLVQLEDKCRNVRLKAERRKVPPSLNGTGRFFSPRRPRLAPRRRGSAPP